MSAEASLISHDEAISARLDRLPATRYIWSLVVLLSLGGCFEYYDLFFTAYFGPGLVRSGLFSSTSARFFGANGLASFVSATFIGLFLGTLFFGFVADTLGRRSIFTCSLLWYAAATLMMAFQQTADSILLWRLIAGIGIGVELVTIDSYITELVPKSVRGRAFAVNHVVSFISVPIVALLAWRLVPMKPWGLDGWRWVVMAGSVGAVFVWFIRQRIPESPRWLIARGRFEEASAVASAMEGYVEKQLGSPLPVPELEPLSRGQTKENILEIFRPPYRSRTAMLMIFNFFQTIGYYGFASWVPTLIVAGGVTITLSLKYSFIIAIAAPIGPLIALSVADNFERKWQIVASAATIGVFGMLFAYQRNPVWLIACGVILTCSNNWMSLAFHAYQAELFPTRVRAQAVGVVYSWSRISAALTSFMIGFFLRGFGVVGVFSLMAASMLAVILCISIFGPRTRGLALEVISR